VQLAGTEGTTTLEILLAPLQELLLSGVLGGAAGLLLIGATLRVARSDLLATASFIAILLTSGLADYLGVSPLLSCLFLGVVLANLTPEKEEVGDAVFADFQVAILAAFFTLAGMELNFEYLLPGGFLALLLVASRLLGKIAAGFIAMTLAGTTKLVRRYLGLALIPQAGVAIGLMLVVAEDPRFASISDLFLAVGLASVTVNEIIGPVLTRAALAGAGEAGKDRPRLIDFIQEENIVTDLKATSKEDAIEQLTDLLIQSHELKVDREQLLQSVLKREEKASAAVGNGLAIPRGILKDGERMVGVVGLSPDGIPCETPDGEMVRCMVLLATPARERDRYLEVLAALARSIGSDPNVRRQLYNARSAAHAYELLHAGEAEGFNYFFEQ
jgi:mannitol/fructose-specific phosphotransferase system IIA component (Ntr-type)